MRQLKTYTSLWAMQPHDQSGVKLPYDQVCEMVSSAITSDVLADDRALPSCRELAEQLSVSRNTIFAAYNRLVDLEFLVSRDRSGSFVHPKMAAQPMAEDALLTGPLEPTNEWYAVAKIAGIKLCESYNRQYGRDYRSVMPTNLYGPGDNFHPENSHVLPALIRRFHEAKETGLPIYPSGRTSPGNSQWNQGEPSIASPTHPLQGAIVIENQIFLGIKPQFPQPLRGNNLILMDRA